MESSRLHELKKDIVEVSNSYISDLRTLSQFVYDHPELGYEEYQASKAHIDLLEDNGFDLVKEYMGMETAFKASREFGENEDKIHIGFLCEYDALPTLGHACGHHLLGMVSTGAGIVLGRIAEENNLNLKISVFGTPAEETSGSKVEMVEKGAFDDVDIALVSHPGDDYYKSGKSLALRAIEIEFFGQTSHAASCPDKGLNALDAMINTFNSINALRQQIRPSARIHGIIKEGGVAANVIPDYTKGQFYIRADSKNYLDQLTERFMKCVEFGAYASGCKYKTSDFEASYADLKTNHILSELYTESLYDIGVEFVNDPRESFGSLDAGDVSHVVPTIHPYHKIAPKGVAAHTSEFTKEGGSDYAFDQSMNALNAMVLTCIKIERNPKVLKDIKEAFKS